VYLLSTNVVGEEFSSSPLDGKLVGGLNPSEKYESQWEG